MRALVTGATGFIGRQLLERLDSAVVLSRNPEQARSTFPKAEVLRWDPMAGPPPADAFRGVEAIFHLAGEPVAEGRWNAAKKQRLRDSRVIGTQHLVQGLEASSERPPVLVSASAVGFYGSRGDEVLDESAAPGNDFLAELCKAWEASAQPARASGVRVVNPRIGIVLGPSGGALAKMLTPFKLGVGGRLGSGKQWMPWIHLDDMVGILLHAVTHTEVEGPINGAAPNPATNRDFTKTLAGVLHRPAIFPAPAFALRLALGEFADVLLGSQRVVPTAAQRTGYVFQHPDLADALRASM